MRRLLWFFIPLLSYGQCDIEILGFDPISTDLLITVNGGYCGSPNDSIGEFILALGFNPPLENNPWPCFGEGDWMLLLYPLDFPGFNIGEGADNILQTGDTLLFNIIEDTPMAGSGTLECWKRALQEGSFFDECVVLTVWQINDSGCLDGSCEGLGGFPYPDEDIWNSWLEFSLDGACDPPPPPVDPEPTDTTTTPPPPPVPTDPDCEDPCIHVPNTFTPNNDGLNDRWKPITLSECWMDWEVQVYNRWGNRVWWSTDPEDWWLGGDVSYVPDGVYTWKIRGTTYRSTKAVSMVGHVTIFR